MAKIYVASSWRNNWQPEIVELLRKWGHEVYDFRHPTPNNYGFAWSSIDKDWLFWQPHTFRECLNHSIAEKGFGFDMRALNWCDTCLLVLPCGRSAHLELGYAIGQGKRTAIYMPEKSEPELMYKMVDRIIINERELGEWSDSIK